MYVQTKTIKPPLSLQYVFSDREVHVEKFQQNEWIGTGTVKTKNVKGFITVAALSMPLACYSKNYLPCERFPFFRLSWPVVL